MAFTNGLDVDIGDPTKASDYDTLADNPEWLRDKADVQHHFDISAGDGTHKDITFKSGTGNITMNDDKWIGLGASAGRIEFDDQSTDEVNILSANVAIGSDSAVLSLGVGADATLTHDGTTGVTLAATPITLDSGGNLTLDPHTGVHIFKDQGSEILRITEEGSGQVTVKVTTDARDLVFTDHGNATGLTVLDAAVGIRVPGEVQTTGIAYTDGDNAIVIADGGGVTFAATVDVNGGAIDGTAIGASAASSGAFTTLTASGDASVGDDLLLTSSGSVVNWNSGDVTLTHAAGKLTWGGDGAVELDFGNHEMTNVDINSGAIDGAAIGAASASTGAFTTLSATGDVSLNGGTFVFNEAGADKDLRIESYGQAYCLFVDASTDSVVLGGSSGVGPLTVWSSSGATNTRLVGRSNGTTDEAELLFTHNDAATAHGNITGRDTQLVLSGGTTQAMWIDSSGNIGIGGDGDNHLHIKVGTGTQTLRVDASGGTGGSSNVILESDRPGSSSGQEGGKLQFYNQGTSQANYAEIKGLVVSDTTGILQFVTSATTAMEIDENQNIEVFGKVHIKDVYDGSAQLNFTASSGSGNAWEIYPHTGGLSFFDRTNTRNTLWLDNDGDVSIGTDDPDPFSWGTHSLTLWDEGATNSNANIDIVATGTGTAALIFGGGTSSGTDASIRRASIYASDGSHLGFATNNGDSGDAGTERMQISNAGVVDIGSSFECNADGVVKWGSSKDYGLLTWDTGKAIVGGQSGKDLELQADSEKMMTLDGVGKIYLGRGATNVNVIGDASSWLDIHHNTTDGTDNHGTRIGGGGDVSDTRGAFVQCMGNEYPGDEGNLYLRAGRDSANGHLRFYTDGGERMRIVYGGEIRMYDDVLLDAKVLKIKNAASVPSAAADHVFLYATDVPHTSELKVLDESGNHTTLSPHNFSLIEDGPSEEMAWSYYSERGGKKINADMTMALRLLEGLTGEKLVYTT